MNSTSYNPRISSIKSEARSGRVSDNVEDVKSSIQSVKLPQKGIDVQRLITLVSQHEPLYNPRHCQFRDKPYTTTIWKSIALQLGTTAHQAKKKWQNLRSNYRREKRKLRDSNLSRTHIWPNYHRLKFLEPFSQFYSTEDDSCDVSDSTPQKPKTFMTAEVFYPESEDPTYEYLSENDAPSEDDAFCSLDEPIRKSAKFDGAEVKARDTQQIGGCSSLADDPDMLFFKGLLPHIKQLGPADKLAFKREVVQLLERKL